MAAPKCRVVIGGLIAMLMALNSNVSATVELVMIVHRHGARTVLVKNATSLAEGGTALTPQGADQLRTIGKSFREQYLDSGSCGKRCIASLPRGSYDGTNVRIISSDFDRTLASAISFGQGAFPVATGLPTPIPVYSTPPPDDWIIRAYENCPAYLQRMNTWFGSDEFKAMEKKVAPLMQKLTTILGQNVTLNNFWNTFDELNTQRDAVLLNGKLTLNAALQEPTWSQVVDTANWLESHRYGRDIAGNLIGGTLLNELLYRMAARIADTQPAAQRFIEYSAHYPTILALLATLPLDNNATVFLSKIPAYGALLAFELRKAAGGEYVVALWAQDGANATYLAVPLPCARRGDAAEQEAGAGACTYTSFVEVAQRGAITTQGRWCALCNNTAMDACLGIRASPAADNPATYDFTLNKTSAAATASGTGGSSGTGGGGQDGSGGGFCAGLQQATTSGKNDDGDTAGKIVGAAIGGAVGASLLTAAALLLVFKRRRPQSWRDVEMSEGHGKPGSVALSQQM